MQHSSVRDGDIFPMLVGLTLFDSPRHLPTVRTFRGNLLLFGRKSEGHIPYTGSRKLNYSPMIVLSLG